MPPNAPNDPGQVAVAVSGGAVYGPVVGDNSGTINATYNLDEQQYDVRGLPNPYLGLGSFTYADRASYAGREAAVEAAVAKLTNPGAATALLFITGASGSGKSSFAQAGLLPALEAHYQSLGRIVRWAVVRPSQYPLAGIIALLPQLGIADQGIDLVTILQRPGAVAEYVQAHTPPQQINVLVLDQFEELFTQSQPPQRDAMFTLLARLPPFQSLRTHVIATMRSDYLPELFQQTALYDQAKAGIDLRVMSPTELQVAIQRPLQLLLQRLGRPPDAKCFEEALLERLALDASGDAAYLPLLQVTLEDLWARGSLKLSAYDISDAYSSLARAIRQRADQVYSNTVVDGQLTPRPAADRATIMQIFLDLVEVSLDDDSRRDVRRRRTYDDLAHSAADRVRLIEELGEARLLSRTVERRADGTVETDVVDIIHEALIRNWERLRTAIEEQRQVLQQRVRFEQALREWIAQNRSDDYLLAGVRLAEARALDKRDDIALRDEAGQSLLKASNARREAEQQRELAQAKALADEQRERAEEAMRAAVRQRRLIIAVAVTILTLVIAGWTGVYALTQQRQARARLIIAGALTNMQTDPERSVLLARQAVNLTASSKGALPEAEDVLIRALRADRLQGTLQGHSQELFSVAWSPDGTRVATSSADGTAKIWDTASRKEVLTVAQGTPIKQVAFSPDGNRLATAGLDGTAKIWDAASGAKLRTFAYPQALEAVVWSPDGARIATGSQDGTVTIWNVADGQQLRSAKLHDDAVNSIAWSPDGTRLATGGSDKLAKIWQIDGSSEPFVIGADKVGAHIGGIYGIAFNNDGSRIATASRDTTAKVWDVATGRLLLTLPNHTAWVTDIDYNRDGTRIATASQDGTAKIWDALTGRELFTLYGHRNFVQAVAFSPDGTRLATGSRDTTAKLWTYVSGEVAVRLAGPASQRHQQEITGISYNKAGTLIATGSWDRTVKVWDAGSGKLLRTLPPFGDQVFDVAFSPDDSLLATAGKDRTVKLWDPQTGGLVRALPEQKEAVSNVAWSPDSKLIAATIWNGTLKIWNAATGQEIRTIAIGGGRAAYGVAWSPDGTSIAAGRQDGTLQIWTVASGQIARTIPAHTDQINYVAWSPNGKLIATASNDRQAKVWDVATGKEAVPLPDNIGVVTGVVFSTAGTRLATSSKDGVTRVWEIPSGRESRSLAGATNGITHAAWSPDGTRLAVPTDERAINVYPMRTSDLMTLATQRVTRSLTAAECSVYLQQNRCPTPP